VVDGTFEGPFSSSLLCSVPPILDPLLEYLHHTILQHQLSNLPDDDVLDEEVVVEVAEVVAEVVAVVVVVVATATEVGAVAAPNC
jgi:hypothetical protein